MSRWSTIQQEGHAIYYAITQWDFLLRDRHFTLRTDHDNLTMLKEELNVKVVRWMLALQAYDFQVEHIKGTLNIVADGLSRLCPDERSQTLRKSTAPPNSFTETGSALQNNDDSISNERGKVKEDVLELESFDFVDLLSIPRLLIAQRIENHRHYAIQIECWALSVSKQPTLSDDKLTERINEVHNDTIGHHGINRTITLVKESPMIREAIMKDQLILTRIRNRVTSYIRTCPCCQKMFMGKILSKAKPFTLSSNHPMETLMIDYIEGLPQDDLGYSHIAVVIDCFSRYCTLFPMKTTKASELARALLSHGCLFGIPDNIVTDKGPAFTSEVFSDLMLLLGIKHHKTLTGSKEETGIVERLNKEVMRHLRNIVFDKRVYNTWSQNVPFVQRIINSVTHSSTGVSPSEIITPGLNLNRNLIPSREPDETEAVVSTSNFPEWINVMLNLQTLLTEKARENLKARDAQHLLEKNEANKNEVTHFPIGSYVLAEKLNFFTLRKETDKLKPYLKGPFKVEAHSDDYSKYTVRNLVTMKLRTFHVKRLKAFLSRPEDTDLTQYAVRDEHFWIVKEIVDFRPKSFNASSSRKNLEFRIEWEIDGSQTWEPWSLARKLKALETFMHSIKCKNKFLKKLVPIDTIEEEIESDEEFDREEEQDKPISVIPKRISHPYLHPIHSIEVFY